MLKVISSGIMFMSDFIRISSVVYDFKHGDGQPDRNLHSSVSIATGYRLDDPGSIPGRARLFSLPQCPDWLCGPSSL
jgi:hypothetical protein